MTTPEILQAVAQYIQPGCPPDSIPDSETLATWVTNECPSDVRAAADTLLMAIWKRSAGWLVSGNGEPDSPPRRLIASVRDVLDLPDEVVVPGALSILELERVHSAWLRVIEDRPMHPLVPLVLMWQQRPEALKPEANALRIMPKGLMNAAPSAVYVDEPLYDPAFLPMTGHVEDSDSLQLALFPTVDGESDLPSVTPLILASAAGFGALKLGRGARLDKRLLIYSLLHMPLDQRRPRRPIRMAADAGRTHPFAMDERHLETQQAREGPRAGFRCCHHGKNPPSRRADVASRNRTRDAEPQRTRQPCGNPERGTRSIESGSIPQILPA